MRTREYHWSLFHAPEKNQLDGLRTDQVEAVFAAIPKADRIEWFVWKESSPSWKPLEDFPELLASLRRADNRVWETPPVPDELGTKAGTKAGPSTKVSSAVRSKTMTNAGTKSGIRKSNAKPVLTMDENEKVEFSLLRGGVGEDRLNVRFQRKIDIKIIAGDQTYQNSTVDISLKGMSLKNPLPPSLPSYYTVEIKHDRQLISLVCSTIASIDGSPSKRIRIEANEYSNALFTFLLSGAT
jgi:hypothetical protein